MRQDNASANRDNSCYRAGGITQDVIISVLLILFFIVVIPFNAYPADPTYPISLDVYTTRQQTVCPDSIPNAPILKINDVDQYASAGYSSYHLGAGVDAGALLPDGTEPGAYNATETLLHFFTISDIHITDKESPTQVPVAVLLPGVSFGETNTSAYSPVIISTTHVLDAAVQTINALHQSQPFDFGMSLGDDANNTQYNELRWFIDVIDGKRITPSSGAHLGAGSIDYQKPYQSAGLDKSIPWYQVIGNHDQFWCGSLFYDSRARSSLVSDTVFDLGFTGVRGHPTFDVSPGNDYYVGLINGATQYGTIIDYGAVETTPRPTIVADPRRRSLTTSSSTSLNWMTEFFNTTSNPQGHGYTQSNLDNDFTSYSFEPKADVPIKIISLDDTCKANPYGLLSSYARGCLDQERYDWLVNELNQGQAEGKLMIIAAHVPVGPQSNNSDAYVPSGGVPNNKIMPVFISTCRSYPATVGEPCPLGVPIEYNDPIPPYTVVTDAMLLDTLHNYPNLILWISGHRHQNTVTPQPAPENKGPEYGFWEVETSSLRDFPQQFRTFRIVLNDNNTVSIFITNVDPAVQGNSPAAKSRGYAIGAHRISKGNLTDTGSYAYNAELIKPLPYTLTVKVMGLGTVQSSSYSGVSCDANSSCSSTYLPNTEVTLVAQAQPGATFAGWSGCDSVSGNNCTVTISVARRVTAAFTACDNGPVMIEEAATFYSTLQAAYNAASNGQSLLMQGFGSVSIFPGGTTLDRNISVTLAGGYSCSYASHSGFTVIGGPLVIKRGTATIENLKVR
jgi:hypothetical protein